MIPNHIKIGNAEKILSQYISENNFSKIGFLSDNNSSKYCLNRILENHKFDYHTITIEEGEENKSLSTCEKVWEELINLKFDRNSLLINVGGGVICDLGGFVASTYMRGIDFINIPTTLLSQVDASVGGKLGVDFQNLKNIIGVFREPNNVIIDTTFLQTLSERELRSGFAEVIKHCLIRDRAMFDKILKKEWKFNGYVVSDWGAALETVENANGGLDLEMPGPAKTWGGNLVDAVKNGFVEEETIDEKVKRILNVAKFTNRFNKKRVAEKSIDKKSHRELIKKTAIEGMVLLKNEEVLPFDKTKISKIALIGPNVKDSQIIGGGSAGLKPHYEVHPLEGVSNFLKEEKVKINYAKGCHVDKYLPALEKESSFVPGKKENGFEVEFFRGKTFDGEAIAKQILSGNRFWALQGFAREFLDEKERPELSVKFSTTYKPKISGEFEFEVFSIGLSRIKINGKELVDNWSSQKKGEAFFGFACAPKRNKIKLSKGREYLVEVEYEFEGRFPAIQFGCRPPDPKNLLEEAVKVAKQSDAVVLVVGTNSDWETEGNDRKSLSLPGEQDALIKKILATNKNTVLVINTGSPVSMPWIKSCPAILQTWFPGQEFGNALAEILFGKESPSGKLPTTYPKKLSDTPAYSSYPGKNLQMDYKEKLLVGYKWYDKKKIEPLFPFGHGLSYSKFKLKKVSVTKKKHEIKIKVKLKNIGDFSTFETVQCYLERKAVKAEIPKKKLVDFKKLKITKNKSKKLTLKVSKRDLSEWDVKKSKWEIAKGDYTIHLGTSVKDISITEEIKI